MSWKKSLANRMYQKEPLKRCILHHCKGVCCTHGVWIDLKEKRIILENVDVVRLCMDSNSGDYEDWFDTQTEEDPYTESEQVIHSKLIKRNLPFPRTTCIFLRKDHKCALQVASQKIGKHPWYLKPFYCILHPMDINQDGEITLDETRIIIEEEKSCLRISDDYLAPIEVFEEELRYLLGYQRYHEYLNQAYLLWASKSDKEIE